MKLSSQSRSFVKQVRVDLVALCDADLCNVIEQWIERSLASEGALDVPEETLLALGYTRAAPDSRLLTHHQVDAPGTERERRAHWEAPSAQQLRALLLALDLEAFAQHVIIFAYQSLHPTHPEWYDAETFNAHLANYLRRIREETAKHAQRTMQKDQSKLR